MDNIDRFNRDAWPLIAMRNAIKPSLVPVTPKRWQLWFDWATSHPAAKGCGIPVYRRAVYSEEQSIELQRIEAEIKALQVKHNIR